MTMRLLFKVTGPNGEPWHGGSGRWPLPTQNPDGTWTPGAPLTVSGPLVPCVRGLHLCTADQLVGWLGPMIHLAQVTDGVEEVDAGDKLVVRTARLERTLTVWDERIARHFACDCAERVLHLTTDPRPAEAVRIARLLAEGRATKQEMAAAWAAAAAAAWDAAGAAARAAAGAAAGDAAGASWAAARAAENQWQSDRLMHYLRGGQP